MNSDSLLQKTNKMEKLTSTTDTFILQLNATPPSILTGQSYDYNISRSSFNYTNRGIELGFLSSILNMEFSGISNRISTKKKKKHS